MNAVFLPGFLCDERVWHNQVEALSGEVETKVVDLRYCQDLNEMVQKVADIPWRTFNLVGFSMGGYVAQVFASKYPERLKSLSLVATSGGALSPSEVTGRLRMESILSKAKYKGLSPKEMARYVHPDSLNNPEITDLIISMSATNTSEMYLNQMRATLYREDMRQTLQNLEFPISIIGAVEDRVATRQELETLATGVPRAQFTLIEGCGHYIPLEKPLELTALIQNFLRP